MSLAILSSMFVTLLANICMLHIVQQNHSSITDVKVHHISTCSDEHDVPCRMFMRASQKRRTTIQPEGKEATWNESFKLPVHIPESQKLELILYDHDNIGSDDELGR